MKKSFLGFLIVGVSAVYAAVYFLNNKPIEKTKKTTRRR